MAWENFDNIRGPKGDKGDRGTISSISVASVDPSAAAKATMTGTTDVHVHLEIPRGETGPVGPAGTLSSVTAEAVPAGSPAAVIMSGTPEVKHAHFEIPRGLPGTNAIENDAAVAAYVGAFDSATSTQLNNTRPVHRVWNGSAYPARVAGAVNLFIGPVDPGLLMSGNDAWTNPDVATLGEVTAAMLDPGSALYAATKKVLPPETHPLQLLQGPNVTGTFGSSQPNVVRAVALAKGGTNGVQLSGRIPDGWNTVSLRYAWIHNAATGSNARLNTYWSLAGATGIVTSSTQTSTFGTPAMNIRTITYEGIPVAGGQMFSGAIVRLSDNPADDIAGELGVTAAWLVRTT